MVTNITSLTGNGLKDWLIQRVSALYLALYTLYLLGYAYLHPQMNFLEWQMLFSRACFQVLTIMALFSFLLHSWVGIWTVTTDYIRCKVIRISVQLLVLFWLVVQLIWGIMILWGHA